MCKSIWYCILSFFFLTANNLALSNTFTPKNSIFYKTWCLLSNLRVNWLLELVTTRRFPSCPGSLSLRPLALKTAAASTSGGHRWPRRVHDVRASRDQDRKQILTGMQCAAGRAHFERASYDASTYRCFHLRLLISPLPKTVGVDTLWSIDSSQLQPDV